MSWLSRSATLNKLGNMAVVAVAARIVSREKIQCGNVMRVLYCTAGAGETSASPQEIKPQIQKPKPAVESKLDITTYKVKEYYGHKEFTFYDIDMEMNNKRLKQPSSLMP